MKWCALTLILSLSLIACGSLYTQVPAEMSVHRQDMVNELKTMQVGVNEPPSYLVKGDGKKGGEFDANQYFSVLDQLSLQEGFVLDYLYYPGQIGGEPILYPRRSDQPAYQTYAELTEAEGDQYTLRSSAFHTSIQVDDSEAGFLQFVILRVMGNQFYQYWHAKYNDYKVICNDESLKAALLGESDNPRMSIWVKWRARRLRPEPQVVMGDDKVQVKIVIFTAWGGFLQRTYTISRQFPHTIIDEQKKILVPYDCGALY